MPFFAVSWASTIVSVSLITIVVGWFVIPPFTYPYFKGELDVTGKTNPNPKELLDEYLMAGNFDKLASHKKSVDVWHEVCQRDINNSFIYNVRRKQYYKVADDEHMYKFKLVRKSEESRGIVGYNKSKKALSEKCGEYICSYEDVLNEYNSLKSDGKILS